MTESRKGISANQLKRTLGVSYKTACYLTHRIRAAMGQVEQAPLLGIVEVDETYVCVKARGKGRGYIGNKTMVLVAVSRDGRTRLKVDQRDDRRTLHCFIKAHVADDAEAIFTDEWPAYRGIEDEDTRHETVNNHRQGVGARRRSHEHSRERVEPPQARRCGHLPPASEKHMPAYLDEFEFRFNNRENPYIFMELLRTLMTAAPLTIEALIA